MHGFFRFLPGAAAFLFTFAPAWAGKKENDDLLSACEAGNSESVSKALNGGADPNASGTWREAPALQVALDEGHATIVEMLAKAGADFSLRAEDGDTALHAAARASRWGNEGMAAAVLNLNRVLEHGLPVNVKNKAGQEPLEMAAGSWPELVRILLEKGAAASPQALAAALSDTSRASVEMLLAAGADPKAVLPDGRTMLHALSEARYYDSGSQREDILWLLDLMARVEVPVNARDEEECTPLMLAAEKWCLPVIDWLLAHGADAKAVDREGVTALMRAGAGEGWNPQVADRLLHAGCPVNAVDRQGRSVLDRAVARGNWFSAAYLLRNGAAATHPGDMLRTALTAWREIPAEPACMRHIAGRLLPSVAGDSNFRIGDRPLAVELVFLGDAYLLDLALKKGARAGVADGKGRTALMWAAAFRNAEMESLLRKAGADPAATDASGKTAKEWADLAAVRLLQDTGPAADAERMQEMEAGGKTALEIAVAFERADRIRRLLEEGNPIVPGVLAQAVRTGNTEITELLLTHGAKVNDPDREGNPPVCAAAATWDRGMMDLLLRHGADLTLKNGQGLTVMDGAREAGYTEWAEELARRAAGGGAKAE